VSEIGCQSEKGNCQDPRGPRPECWVRDLAATFPGSTRRILEILPAPAVVCLRPELTIASSFATYVWELFRNISSIEIYLFFLEWIPASSLFALQPTSQGRGDSAQIMDTGLPDLQSDPSAHVVDFKLAPFATPASDVNRQLRVCLSSMGSG
jgi:hypothetical protein